MPFGGHIGYLAPGTLVPPDRKPDCGALFWVVDRNGFFGFRGDIGVDVKTEYFLLGDFVAESVGWFVEVDDREAFGFPVKNGCVIFEDDAACADRLSFSAALRVGCVFVGIIGSRRFPFNICVILTPISFRSTSFFP